MVSKLMLVCEKGVRECSVCGSVLVRKFYSIRPISFPTSTHRRTREGEPGEREAGMLLLAMATGLCPVLRGGELACEWVSRSEVPSRIRQLLLPQTLHVV